jgi:hypothetical protein
MTRVLIVENQKKLLQKLKRGLVEEGYDVITASTGEEIGTLVSLPPNESGSKHCSRSGPQGGGQLVRGFSRPFVPA